MNKIKNIPDALEVFKDAANVHGEATEIGNYKLGNKNYDSIIKAIDFLIKEKAIDHLHQFLVDSNTSVRLWSATYLLPLYEQDALKALNSVA
ncbi:MAG: hypothetical protein ABI203_09785, partial [Mucilaginibacter sp.]